MKHTVAFALLAFAAFAAMEAGVHAAPMRKLAMAAATAAAFKVDTGALNDNAFTAAEVADEGGNLEGIMEASAARSVDARRRHLQAIHERMTAAASASHWRYGAVSADGPDDNFFTPAQEAAEVADFMGTMAASEGN
ncbi:hypothetical protein COO60DRAFT_1496152 [Scenedesmus sp. NREL 46B-D3]|nr:hypothetical protein COO60DRAFT_1496152 [Scenedesmus sp. NREL 46B-D3]